MYHQMLQHRFAALTTAPVADACIRARVPVRALLRSCVLWCLAAAWPGVSVLPGSALVVLPLAVVVAALFLAHAAPSCHGVRTSSRADLVRPR